MNGVFDGEQQTFPKLLQRAGYQTAIIGKWHLAGQPTGFDHYDMMVDHGQFYECPMNRIGSSWGHGAEAGATVYEGYLTDVITDESLAWLDQRGAWLLQQDVDVRISRNKDSCRGTNPEPDKGTVRRTATRDLHVRCGRFGLSCNPVKGYYPDMNTVLEELETLSVPERLQIVEDLWDSIARSNARIPVPQWQKDELGRRKRRYLQNPDSGRPWEQVKQDILQAK